MLKWVKNKWVEVKLVTTREAPKRCRFAMARIDDAVCIQAMGVLDAYSSPQLKEVFGSVTGHGICKVHLDLSKVDDIDSNGLGSIVSMQARLRQGLDREELEAVTNNAAPVDRLSSFVNICAATPRIKQILDITGLFEFIPQNTYSAGRLTFVDIANASDVGVVLSQVHGDLQFTEFLLTVEASGYSVDMSVASPDVYVIKSGKNSPLLIGRAHSISAITRSHWSSQLDELQRLVENPKVREVEIQSFFEEHPNFILGGEYTQLRPQVLLADEDGRALRPDFMLESMDNELWDILELKLPIRNLVVGSEYRTRFSSELSEAVAQLHEYRTFFDDPNNRDKVYRRYGIRAFRPRLAVVIGRSVGFDSIQRRIMEDHHRDVKVITYDDLIKRAKARLLW